MKKTKNETSQPKSARRREVIKKGAYAVPAVLTLAVKPSFSSAASGTIVDEVGPMMNRPPRRPRN
jgi:hypothetical protein